MLISSKNSYKYYLYLRNSKTSFGSIFWKIRRLYLRLTLIKNNFFKFTLFWSLLNLDGFQRSILETPQEIPHTIRPQIIKLFYKKTLNILSIYPRKTPTNFLKLVLMCTIVMSKCDHFFIRKIEFYSGLTLVRRQKKWLLRLWEMIEMSGKIWAYAMKLMVES